MPELREMFEMTTRDIEPDLDAWRDQERSQQRHAARRKRGALLMAAALAVATTVIAIQVARDVGRTTTPAHEGSAVPTATIHTIGGPSGIVEAGGSVWVSTHSGVLYRIDPNTNAVTDRIDIGPSSCGDLVADGETILVSGCGYWPPVYTLRIDATTGKVLDTWPSGLVSPVFGSGKAWAFDAGAPNRDGAEVDPQTGQVIKTLADPPLGYAFGSLWFEEDASGSPRIVKVDPNTYDEIASYRLPAGTTARAIHGEGGGFAEAGGYVWIVTYGPTPGEGALIRIDPSSGAVDDVLSVTYQPISKDFAKGAVFLDASGGLVWLAQTPDLVVGVDAATAQVVQSFPAAGGYAFEYGATGGRYAVQVSNVAATRDSLWVLNFADDSVWRYDLTQG